MHKKSMPLSAMLCVYALIFAGFTAAANTCKSSLSVYKDRVYRSADVESGTRFTLELSNNSGSSQTYSLLALQAKTTCDMGKMNGFPLSKTQLDVSFDFESDPTGETITVPPNEKITFKAAVNVPEGAATGEVACIEIMAKTAGCPEGRLTTQVNVLITDPTEN